MRTPRVGRTVDLSTTCEALTNRGRRCSQRAHRTLQGMALCVQHHRAYERIEVKQVRVTRARRRTLRVLHFSDLHGHQRATQAALSACRGAEDGRVVVVTGDVGSRSQPAFDPGWSEIPQSDRLAVPGDRDGDPARVFGESRGWTWESPWIRVLGRFSFIGLPTGSGARSNLHRTVLDRVCSRLARAWEVSERRALIVVSHHPIGGALEGRLYAYLQDLMEPGATVLYLHGHDHQRPGWRNGRCGSLQAWYSNVASCDQQPVGHAITVGRGSVSMEPVGAP